MANDSSRDPIIVDTAGPTVVFTMPLNVKRIRWVGATTAGHQAVIQDPTDDRVLWESVAAGANYVEADNVETVWPNGFKVPTLDTGTLYIQVGRNY